MTNAGIPGRETAPSIGFLGFGEAGFHIAKGLREAGITRIAAFDINQRTEMPGGKIRARAADADVPLLPSNQALAEASEWIISVVTADQALQAAKETAPHLNRNHLYADLNSVSPARKQAIAALIDATRARFIEVAVMAPVPSYGQKVPMLAGGSGAEEFFRLLCPFGVRGEVVSTSVGTASATKMLRSIIVKGLESLITECVLGASYYGADRRVLASLAETFPGIDWPQLANYMVGRVVVHGERRAREMEEVCETLRCAGIDPIMAEATVRRMDWSVEAGLNRYFGGKAPASYSDVAAALAEMRAEGAGDEKRNTQPG